MRFALVVATRPDLIKMAPVIKAFEKAKLDYVTIHGDQHYDDPMDKVFTRDLKMRPAAHRIKTSHGTYGCQVSETYHEARRVLDRVRADAVLVYGDTMSAYAFAIAAEVLDQHVIHVEAGMRTEPQDLRLPEESFRVMIDAVAYMHFAPTDIQKQNLENEGKTSGVHVVGNTVFDSIGMVYDEVDKSSILKKLELKGGKYLLLTMHRSENVDDPAWLAQALDVLDHLTQAKGEAIVWPMHPRVQKRMAEYKLKCPAGVMTIPPVGYIDMLKLIEEADVVLTDSGGVPEECTVLRVPCLIMRRSTERPEVIRAGCAELAHVPALSAEQFAHKVEEARRKDRSWQHPYGDPGVADRIVAKLREFYGV